MKKKPLVLLLFFVLTFAHSQQISFIHGSNIYVKIFLFFFPIGMKYETFFHHTDDGLSITIDINQDEIINEPINEQDKARLFNTDLSFNIRGVQIGKTGRYTLPVTIRCNRKIIRRDIDFTVITEQNIMVMKGHTNIHLGEFNDNPLYKNRSNWKYPFHFDLRFQLQNN
ncbi:MAG: hypothetical protein A2015_01120 [Spirochaetes bacterium GWF1_31_7]|nr:MAG: hypothetical protein A2Y30_01020 [Spirochaetes bacterium GWE1_32_154]OHD47900.1 MAG: hypothetical protein A2015_01120 [Spirochaetes bacterium GWF1_31_7]OHD48891.1 MAG: hypothetical protein A2Y29_16835 [Spirochaetes bacterium GWE2_31_10]OHD82980.1 MAG: hypothetical protein A2355_04325 [Spirochaetes bacterium RIFOXYB1_FULL_32_8]HBD96524.1 hypothetical protein [Spirochaetia bacterium]